MATRTFGWVQNPNRLDTLKNVVSVFVAGSLFHKRLIEIRLPIILKNGLMQKSLYNEFMDCLLAQKDVISYDMLKGKGSGNKSRKEALCTGIIQASIDAQRYLCLENEAGIITKMKKPYTDDWTADGYLRWAISTGLLIYDEESDTCTISELGKQLVESENSSEEEREILTKALLSYPPVCRVLDILSDQTPHTKFEIGAKLGFKGEMGFTSIPQAVFVHEFCNEKNARKKATIYSNLEGDSDKYARTIARWLEQMGWAEKCEKTVCETYLGRTGKMQLNAWKITRSGEKALTRSKGNSKNPRIEKIVPLEMLATKVPDAKFIRLRRAYILQSLKKYRTLESIQKFLKENVGLNETVDAIKDEITNFENIGLSLSQKDGKFRILDKIIGLKIPTDKTNIEKSDITTIKDCIRTKLHTVNHDYLILVDLAYSDASTKTKKNSDAKDFEIQTAKLLTEELLFSGERLGDANRPDVIVYYNKFGTIIDNKSYKNGFSVDQHCADEMNRYVIQNNKREPGIPKNEWWKCFDPNVTDFSFLFVTSFLKGRFQDNLEEMSRLTNTNGAAIGVESLLYLAEALKSGKQSYENISALFQNKEIKILL